MQTCQYASDRWEIDCEQQEEARCNVLKKPSIKYAI